MIQGLIEEQHDGDGARSVFTVFLKQDLMPPLPYLAVEVRSHLGRRSRYLGRIYIYDTKTYNALHMSRKNCV